MPNKAYEQGVRWERDCKRKWEADGYVVIRASGSHGIFDLVCIPKGNESRVYGVQCKVTASKKRAMQLTAAFRRSPPLPRGACVQILSVKLLGTGLKVEVIV